jgi:hypothetical protein
MDFLFFTVVFSPVAGVEVFEGNSVLLVFLSVSLSVSFCLSTAGEEGIAAAVS